MADLIGARPWAGKWQELEVNGVKSQQYREESAGSFREIRYFLFKEHVYCVEAAARDMTNPLVKTFFSSIRVGKEAVAEEAAARSAEPQETAAPAAPVAQQQPEEAEIVEGKTPGITKAVILSKPSPMYTEQARREMVTGQVVLSLVLSASGEVRDVKTIDGLKYGLTEEAIKVAKLIIYLPAEKDGRPVSQYVKIEYNFHIY